MSHLKLTVSPTKSALNCLTRTHRVRSQNRWQEKNKAIFCLLHTVDWCWRISNFKDVYVSVHLPYFKVIASIKFKLSTIRCQCNKTFITVITIEHRYTVILTHLVHFLIPCLKPIFIFYVLITLWSIMQRKVCN